mmetsp:Transcript_113866/g.207150  ORF Transcript_113866/g.207150 Transcript_113866/m.207150 type:complete len:551 (-) Transcript_113866:133-1785(-)
MSQMDSFCLILCVAWLFSDFRMTATVQAPTVEIKSDGSLTTARHHHDMEVTTLNKSSGSQSSVVKNPKLLRRDASKHLSATAVKPRSGVQRSLPYLPGVPALGSLEAPRVFIYEVPERFHEGLIEQFLPGEDSLLYDGIPNLSNFSIKCGMAWANSLVGLQRCLRSAASTVDPETADFFYVPFYPEICFANFYPQLFREADKVAESCSLMRSVLTDLAHIEVGDSKAPHGGLENKDLLRKLEEAGLKQLPALWSKSHGRDHIFPSDKVSFSPYARRNWLSSGPIRVFWDFGQTVVAKGWISQFSDVVDDEYMQKLGYAQKKDFLIPLHFLRDAASVPIPDISIPRVHFIYLAASKHTLAQSSNEHRLALERIIRSQPDSLFEELTNRQPHSDTHDRMGKSQFCLAPPGDLQLATRHTDALLAGCIPVVLTDGHVPLPFDNILDWTRFAVLLNTSSIYDGTLLRTLQLKSPGEIRKLRQNVYAVRPYFMLDSKCSRPSGVDMVLHQLALQKNQSSLLQRESPHAMRSACRPHLMTFGAAFAALSSAVLVAW